MVNVVKNSPVKALKTMVEIYEMLNQWVYNSIIREQLRELIIKEINKNEKV